MKELISQGWQALMRDRTRSALTMLGIGWGLVGLCPGPAIADLATLSPGVIVFVIAMAVGMAAHDLWQSRAVRQIEQKLATATDG